MIIHGSGGGGKSGGSTSTPVEVPDNLKSDSFARVLDLVSEGEIEGLVNGLRSIYLDDVPLQNADGTFNFEGVSVETRVGTEGQAAITMFSGTESESAVGVEVKATTPIERSIVNTDTDKIRVTIGIPQLTYQDEKTGDIKGSSVQYKISVSAGGAAFKDANTGGGTSRTFSGNFTPANTRNFRASVRWVPNRPINGFGLYDPATATVRLEYRADAGAWATAGEQRLTSVADGVGVLGQIKLAVDGVTVETSPFEVYDLPPDVYELRAVIVETSEAVAGVVTVVNQGVFDVISTATITGKTTSRYQRSHVIDLRRFGSPPYIVRVTRLTEDSTKTVLQNKTYWDSYTEIVNEKLRYPNSALVAIRLSSKQFQGIPTRGYHMRLKKIKVPSNYDPIARTYSGTWNGTFVVKWSNNPAWVFYDLCTNARYAVGDYVPASLLDKWALYDIAQYCDGLVPDGRGGMEPRYTFNHYWQTREEAYRALVSLASVFRGMVYWGAGAIIAAADKPSDPVYSFTNANVIDGAFNYSGSSLRSRHNAVVVSWNDPANMYRTKAEYVSDDEAIASMGFINQLDVSATGCTSQGQARRVGEWIIYTERFENDTVSFTVGLEGNIPKPNDIVLIADSLKSGARLGGRLKAGSTSTALVLDSSVTLTPSVAYTLWLINAEGKLESRAVSTVSGEWNTLNVASAFTFTPPSDTIWILTSGEAEAQTFRVLGLVEQENGTQFVVNAIRHYPAKFDYIERNQPLTIPDYTKLENLWEPPSAPSGLSVQESLYATASRGLLTRLTVSWEPKDLMQYEFSYKVGAESNWITDPLTLNVSRDIDALSDGEVVYIRVVTVNKIGLRSTSAATSSVVIAGKSAPPSNVIGFVATRSSGTLNFSWRHIEDVDRSYYEIRRGESWPSGTPVGTTSANALSVEEPRGGTFMIKAFDTSGNESVGATSVVTTDGNSVVSVYAHDESAGGWNGGKVNCYSYDLASNNGWGDLTTWADFVTWDFGAPKTGVLMTADSVGDSVYTGEVIDLGSKMRVHVTLNAKIGALNSAIIWSDLTASWSTYTNPWAEYGGDEALTFANEIESLIQIQTSDDNVTWSQPLPYVSGSYLGRYFRFVVTMRRITGTLLGYLYGLTAQFDLRERTLHFEDVAVSVTGATIAFIPEFVQAKTVQVTQQGGLNSDLLFVTGKTNSQVTVQLFTAAGVAKSGVVDVDVFGYGQRV